MRAVLLKASPRLSLRRQNARAKDVSSGGTSARRTPFHEHKKPDDLRSLLEVHVAAWPQVLSWSEDPVFEAFWRAACFHEERLVASRVRLKTATITVVAVPSVVWEVGVRRSRVLALKRAVVAAGRRVLLIPEGPLRREPRLGNALLMARAAQAGIGAEDRIAVMAALAEEPGMLLGDLVHIVRDERDRVAAVLSLARKGVIEVDMRKPIGPLSAIWLCDWRV